MVLTIINKIKNNFEDLAKEHSVAKIDIDPGDNEDETTGGDTRTEGTEGTGGDSEEIESSPTSDSPDLEARKPNLLEQHVSEFSSTETSSPPTSAQKWWISIILGVLFFIISSPIAYKITGGLFQAIGGMTLFTFKDVYPGQTLVALIVHTIIFILIVRLILW